MKEFNIPTASYEVFDDPAKALSYIEEKNEYPVVIKADGLALGKGVIIAANHEEAKEGLHEIMEEKVFGTSGNHVVVEEFLTRTGSFCSGICGWKNCCSDGFFDGPQTRSGWRQGS